MKTFFQFLENQGNNDAEEIAKKFIKSPEGKKHSNSDCKTVTRAFVNWAKQNNIPAKVLLLAPPDPELIKAGKAPAGRSGEGDSHIMPVVNDEAIDFTVRQFDVKRPYENPLITPISKTKQVYRNLGGYYTYAPDWFNNGKTYYLGSFEGQNIVPKDFTDESLS
jgi:hypothetical protein